MTNLEHSHRPLEIRRRLADEQRPSYLPAAILGGIDGCVTTIAVVASVAGAGLPGVVAFVLGAASMVADGFSMAVSNYQAVKSEGDARDRLRRREERHIDQTPEGERDEIRAIFEAKGLEGKILESVVETITEDRKRYTVRRPRSSHWRHSQCSCWSAPCRYRPSSFPISPATAPSLPARPWRCWHCSPSAM